MKLNRAYVTNAANGTVSVFDFAKGLIATVQVMGGPYGIAVMPSKRFVYVTNYDSGTVSVIETRTNRVVKTIFELQLPTRVAAATTPKGERAYVAVDVPGQNGYVAIVDPKNHVVLKSIPVQVQPSGVAFTPDHKHAFVTNFMSNSISVIDTQKEKVMATLGNNFASHQPFGVAVAWSGTKAYLPLQAQNGMFKWLAAVIDVPNMQLVPTNKYVTFFTRSFGVATEPARDFVWFTEDSFNRVDIFDDLNDTMVGSVQIQPPQQGLVGPREIAFTADGAYCYVTCSWADFVAVIDVNNRALVKKLTVPNGSRPFGVATLET